jgi:hypothetical protein
MVDRRALRPGEPDFCSELSPFRPFTQLLKQIRSSIAGLLHAFKFAERACTSAMTICLAFACLMRFLAEPRQPLQPSGLRSRYSPRIFKKVVGGETLSQPELYNLITSVVPQKIVAGPVRTEPK